MARSKKTDETDAVDPTESTSTSSPSPSTDETTDATTETADAPTSGPYETVDSAANGRASTSDVTSDETPENRADATNGANSGPVEDSETTGNQGPRVPTSVQANAFPDQPEILTSTPRESEAEGTQQQAGASNQDPGVTDAAITDGSDGDQAPDAPPIPPNPVFTASRDGLGNVSISHFGWVGPDPLRIEAGTVDEFKEFVASL